MPTRQPARQPARLALAVVLSLLAVGLAACSRGGTVGAQSGKGGDTPFVLRVESSAGDEKVKIAGAAGRSATIPGPEGLTITVRSVDGDRSEITTSLPMTAEGADDPASEFIVTPGEPVTLTSEGGTTYTVTYEEISVE